MSLTEPRLNPKLRVSLQKALLHWYDRSARDLPWRKTRDPYLIWVSEIMLQQTQVATVIPYFEKWMNRFPNLKSLSDASLDEVLKYWAGLGYYRRARMLHSGAQFVWIELRGEVPKDPSLLQKIPGIGRYTAGAISSIAFDHPAAILDGNVMRILTRLFAISESIDNKSTQKKLWDLATALVPQKRAGDFNQSMMELGATVCLPRNPNCSSCPVQKHCKAAASKDAESFPRRPPRESVTHQKRFAAVLVHRQSVLLTQQEKNSRWAGLWIFPTFQTLSELKKIAGSSKKQRPLVRIQHAFTRYKIDLAAYQIELSDRSVQFSDAQRWVKVSALKSFALPAPYQKITEALLRGRSAV